MPILRPEAGQPQFTLPTEGSTLVRAKPSTVLQLLAALGTRERDQSTGARRFANGLLDEIDLVRRLT